MADANNDDQKFDLEIFDKVMKVNLYGSIHAAKYCVEAMKANERNENN
jgi:hypothetical protein